LNSRDIDLSILAANEVEYNKYAESIRKDCSHFPALLYRQGKKVLKLFLNEKNISHADSFQEKFEKQAIANMTREIGNQ
jgi:predicted metal-dependent HD superfamily phosphohydrolase